MDMPLAAAPVSRVGEAKLKVIPPATLYFSDTARNGLKVKYLRATHPQPVANAKSEIRPFASMAMA